MGKLQDERRATIIATPMDELIQSLRDVCDWMAEDGMDASRLRKAVKSAPDDMEPLKLALNAYYGKPKNGQLAVVRPEYKKFAGYLSCICGTVRDIKLKKELIEQGLCEK